MATTRAGFPDMSAYLPARLMGAAELADGWMLWDGQTTACGGRWLDDLLPPEGAGDGASNEIGLHLQQIIHPDDRHLFGTDWLEEDQIYDQLVRLGTRDGWRLYLIRTTIRDAQCEGLVFAVPLRRLIERPMRQRMALESGLARALERLLDADAQRVWEIGASLLPRLAAAMGARRAHLGEVTEGSIRPVQSYLAPGVASAPHRADFARILAEIARRSTGVLDIVPGGGDEPRLEDLMRRRGVERLLMITPDTGRGEAVLVALEVPAAGLSPRDKRLALGVVNILNGAILREEYAGAVRHAAETLRGVGGLSRATPPLPIDARITQALELIREGFAAVGVRFDRSHPAPGAIHVCGRGDFSVPVDFARDIDFSPGGIERVHPEGVLIGARVPMDDDRQWGHLTLLVPAARSRDVAQHRLRVIELIAGWLGTQLTRERTIEHLRRREQNLAALSHRRERMIEAERQHISRELHDSLGQVLTAAGLELGLLRRLIDDPQLQVQLDRLGAAQGEAVALVRALCSDLRPPQLDEMGLGSALRWEAERCAGWSGVEIDVRIDGAEPAMSAHLRDDLYRIAQEALTNVMRHARAERAWVHAAYAPDMIQLTVSDDGAGMAPVSAERPHLGILGMRERATAHGGLLSVAPRAGGGTSILVSIPLEGE